ncbi:class I SAM-dependent methyltransferase [Ancylomarina longa]|uniref:Class I SAM-dependent methyltransferase n=1 Tax=Ancylomarina longa TaxID=2487017 RepID=A0A434ATD4_9BACT|nr:class I SAM-dependent methyltransferase [Ancylomarina longa]RUT77675.1 class I SAM-dependent methyltransferase [Ancylomarina longa]
MAPSCPLCGNSGKLFYERPNMFHYQCETCSGIFADKKFLPETEVERKHYTQHNNDVEDKGYQAFVSPITAAVLRDFTPKAKGLDFGAGTGPVISKVLSDKGFSIQQYDPFFHNHPHLLEDKYDYIACCEVIEHFHNPGKEFALLRNLLNRNGKLYCMTHIYDESIDFPKWYYKNDPTHVFIYHRNTLSWIQKEFGFNELMIDNRLIVFSL